MKDVYKEPEFNLVKTGRYDVITASGGKTLPGGNSDWEVIGGGTDPGYIPIG